MMEVRKLINNLKARRMMPAPKIKMKTIKELEAEKLESEWGKGYNKGFIRALKDVLKLIDEIDATPISAIMRNNRLEDLKARITG